MIPKSLPSDLIRGWIPVFGQDHALHNKKHDPEKGTAVFAAALARDLLLI
jgi:hypothetical protein